MPLFFLQPNPSACLAFQPFFKVFAGLPFNELFKGFPHGFLAGKLPYHDKLYFFALFAFLFLSIGYLHRSEKPDKGYRQQSPATDSEKPATYRLAIVSYFSNFLVKSRCFRCQRTDTHQKALLYGHLSCPYPHFYGNKVSNQPTTNRATSPVNQAIHSFGSSS